MFWEGAVRYVLCVFVLVGFGGLGVLGGERCVTLSLTHPTGSLYPMLLKLIAACGILHIS